ncbi:hypothetical protein G4G93_05275 [Methylobacterium sp. DB0501]|nr:hypothetical protein [Methylobacterium sp. DB0501]
MTGKRKSDLTDLSSDAYDLRNAVTATRIVLDHCLSMTDPKDGATWRTIRLLDEQQEALCFLMLKVERMSRDLAQALDDFEPNRGTRQ